HDTSRAGRTRAGGRASCNGGGARTVRPSARTAVARAAAAARAGRIGLPLDDAPHRLRRLVGRNLLSGTVGALRGVCVRAAVAVAGVAGPVPGLRGVAA